MARKHNLQEFRFKSLPKLLEYSVVNLRGMPRNWEKPRESLLHSPKPLVELAAKVVDDEPLPDCMYWQTEDVEDWVEHIIQLPQYKICFRNNYVQGRHLILLDANVVFRMGVSQFDHIKKILNGIRDLFGVPMPRFAQNLTRPSIYGTAYDWMTLYYSHIAHQSPDQARKRSAYWRSVGLLHNSGRPEYNCHWHSISADAEGSCTARVGRYRKKNLVNYWVPMFREGNFVPTQKKLEYFFMDPLCW